MKWTATLNAEIPDGSLVWACVGSGAEKLIVREGDCYRIDGDWKWRPMPGPWTKWRFADLPRMVSSVWD